MRKTAFANGEYYHIYNRGVDKRQVFLEQYDVDRFLQSMEEFNVIDPIGSIYENLFRDTPKSKDNALVDLVCFCLNPNHYHMLVCQHRDHGIEKFMHKLSTGYTCYFNQRYKRSGSLFQGPYKAIHIDSNEYLLYISAYINLNYKVHQLGGLASKLVRSSFDEYVGRGKKDSICNKNVIISQFKSTQDYEDFSKDALSQILKNKEKYEEMEKMLLE